MLAPIEDEERHLREHTLMPLLDSLVGSVEVASRIGRVTEI